MGGHWGGRRGRGKGSDVEEGCGTFEWETPEVSLGTGRQDGGEGGGGQTKS